MGNEATAPGGSATPSATYLPSLTRSCRGLRGEQRCYMVSATW